MAAPTIFRSEDGSAPTLNGNAGSLISVLDGCLVSGYGSKTALGWGKPFSGTNTAVYRPPTGIRHYLDVNDNGPDATALGRNARVRGYETMTAVATGTGLYPTAAQVATPIIAKSSTADATARPWLLIGDDRTFYLFLATTLTVPINTSTVSWVGCLAAGEFYSVVTADNYRSLVLWGSGTSTATANSYSLTINVASTNPPSPGNLSSIPRTYTGVGSAVYMGAMGHSLTTMPYPNGPDGGLYLSALLMAEASATGSTAFQSGAGFRGRYRGMFQHCASATSFNDGDTLAGVGDYAGRTFMVIRNASNSMLAETTAWPYST